MTVSAPLRPASQSTPPAAAMVPLLLVFICGVAVGALVMSLVHHSGQNGLHAENQKLVQKWTKELNLTEVQQRELITTLDDGTKYYINVIADLKERIREILNDDQKQKFDQILREKRKL